MKEVVSFDMDGTITDKKFADSVWRDGIPRLYKEKYEVGLEEAVKLVEYEYEKVGEGNIEWYDINYWMKYFNLDVAAEDLLKMYEDKIKIFPDALEALDGLKDQYTLVLSTNAMREFVDVQIGGIKDYFTYIFSSTSDLGMVKKETKFYIEVLKEVKVEPENFYHVGDHSIFDHEVPKKVGINAYLLDREGDYEGDHVVRDLREFLDILKGGGICYGNCDE